MKETFCFLKATFLLLFLSVCAHAQNSPAKPVEKISSASGNHVAYKDTIQKIFSKTNSEEIWNLRKEITKLNFDHCNHNEIVLQLNSDSTGLISSYQIITGTSLPKTDSMIFSILGNFYYKFKPIYFNNSFVRALVYIKYKFHNKSGEDELLRTNGNYSLSDAFLKFNSQSNAILNPDARKESNECDDDTYFFNEGVKYFQQGDFGKAIYNFNQALNANPRDMDVMYNLGIAYQKTDKLKKACKCLADGMETSDISCADAYIKYCTELNKK